LILLARSERFELQTLRFEVCIECFSSLSDDTLSHFRYWRNSL